MTVVVLAHIAGVPVEETGLMLLPLAPVLIAGARLAARRALRGVRPGRPDPAAPEQD